MDILSEGDMLSKTLFSYNSRLCWITLESGRTPLQQLFDLCELPGDMDVTGPSTPCKYDCAVFWALTFFPSPLQISRSVSQELSEPCQHASVFVRSTASTIEPRKGGSLNCHAAFLILGGRYISFLHLRSSCKV